MVDFKWAPRAQVFLLLALLLFLTGYFFSSLISVFAGMILLAFILYAKQSYQENLGTVHIKRTTIETVLYINQPIHVKTLITYSGGPTYLSIQDHLPKNSTLVKGDTEASALISSVHPLELSYQVMFHSRGRQMFPKINCELFDRLNLFSIQMDIDTHHDIVLHSNPQDIHLAKRVKMKEDPQLLLTTFLGQDISREFDGVRSYYPGDSSRDIDWKVSSRLQTLATKVFQKQQAADVVIALDVSREMRRTIGSKSKIEHGIALLIQLTYILQSLHHKVGFVAFDEYNIIHAVEPSYLYQNIFKACSELPAIIPIDHYSPISPKNAHVGASQADEVHQKFLSTISPFLLQRHASVRHGVQLTGIYQSALHILSQRPKTHIIVLSDLETNHEAFHAAISLVQHHHSNMWILCMDTPRYNLSIEKIDKDTITNIYKYQEARRELLQKLRRKHVEILELSPELQTPQIIRTIHNT